MTLELLSELVQKHDNCLVVESVLELPKEVVDNLNNILKDDGTILYSVPIISSILFHVPYGNVLTWCYCHPMDYQNKISNTEFLKYFKEPPKCLRRL